MTQEYDTTTERKLWLSGAWGRSLPTSFLQFGPDCIACRYITVLTGFVSVLSRRHTRPFPESIGHVTLITEPEQRCYLMDRLICGREQLFRSFDLLISQVIHHGSSCKRLE